MSTSSPAAITEEDECDSEQTESEGDYSDKAEEQQLELNQSQHTKPPSEPRQKRSKAKGKKKSTTKSKKQQERKRREEEEEEDDEKVQQREHVRLVESVHRRRRHSLDSAMTDAAIGLAPTAINFRVLSKAIPPEWSPTRPETATLGSDTKCLQLTMTGGIVLSAADNPTTMPTFH